MPINIEYQPNLVAIGQLAHQAGLGEYEQRQQQLAEQVRQFDEQLAQQSMLENQRLAADQNKFQTQVGMQQYGMMAENQARREQGLMELERQRMVQDGYAQSAQMQYEQARVREEGEVKRQQLALQNTRAMETAKSAEAWIRSNSPTAEQRKQISDQFEQSFGFPLGFYGDEQMARTMDAADQTAKAKAVSGLVSAANKRGMDLTAEEMDTYLDKDANGNYQINSLGSFIFQTSSDYAKRAHETEGQARDITSKEKIAAMNLNAKQAKNDAEQRDADEKRRIENADAVAKAVDEMTASHFSAMQEIQKSVNDNLTLDIEIQNKKNEQEEDLKGMATDGSTQEAIQNKEKSNQADLQMLEKKRKASSYDTQNFPLIKNDSKTDGSEVVKRLPIGTIFKMIAPENHPKAGQIILLKRVVPTREHPLPIAEIDSQGNLLTNQFMLQQPMPQQPMPQQPNMLEPELGRSTMDSGFGPMSGNAF